MIPQIQQFLEDSEKEFSEKFPCIESGCDGKGNIPKLLETTENGEKWEAEQCEFHAKYLFPIKSTHLASLITLTEMYVGMVPADEKLPKTKCINLESHLTGRCFECEKMTARNQECSRLRNLLTECLQTLRSKQV